MKWFKFTVVLLLFASCKNKDFTDINNPVIEDQISGTKVVFNDIGGYTVLEDSLFGTNIGSVYLGSAYDPLFGRTDASFYMSFEVETGATGTTIPANAVIDSIVLYLKYANQVYLDTMQSLKITVNELNQKLDKDKFNTKTRLSVLPQDLVLSADQNFKLDIARKRVITAGDTTRSILKITLNKSILWPKILSGLISTDSLQSKFKGLFVSTETSNFDGGKGALATFNPTDNKTNLICFYSVPGDTSPQKRLNLTSRTSASNAFNLYTPVYFPGNLGLPSLAFNLQDSTNPVMVNKNLFIQGFGSFAAKINLSGYTNDPSNQSFTGFPTKNAAKYFDSIRALGGQIAVNRALLILKTNTAGPFTDATYKRPFALFATAYDSIGQEVLLTETINDLSGNYLKGTYDDIRGGYVFNITLTMQKLILRKLRLNALRLSVSNGNRNLTRTVLNIDQTSVDKPQLEIYYTRLQ
jgi:hypothetical protein